MVKPELVTTFGIPRRSVNVTFEVSLQIVVQAITFLLHDEFFRSEYIAIDSNTTDDCVLCLSAKARLRDKILPEIDSDGVTSSISNNCWLRGVDPYKKMKSQWSEYHRALFPYALAHAKKLFPELIPQDEEKCNANPDKW